MEHDSPHHHDHHHHEHGDADESALAEILDLDAEVLGSYLAQATELVRAEAGGGPVTRVVDLGAGTGNGALALAALFPDAEVLAVDVSPDFLARIQAKASDRGLAGRVTTVEADLDADWPPLGPADVVWSSLALHHLADPGVALKKIAGLLRPGGFLAVAELTTQVTFLPDELSGLEERLSAVQAEERVHAMPYLGADWGELLVKAGFTVAAERNFEIDLTPPLPEAAGRFAQVYLRRTRERVGDALSPDDQAVWDEILADHGPQAIRQRQDLAIRGTRTVWIGRV
jgi:SAM-dependent methyltransferase